MIKLYRIKTAEGDVIVPSHAVDVIEQPNDGIKFAHFRPNFGGYAQPSFTFAYTVVSGVMFFGWSSCIVGDNFCRKTGRDIAVGRMNARPIVVDLRAFSAGENAFVTDVVEALVKTSCGFDMIDGFDIKSWLCSYDHGIQRAMKEAQM